MLHVKCADCRKPVGKLDTYCGANTFEPYFNHNDGAMIETCLECGTVICPDCYDQHDGLCLKCLANMVSEKKAKLDE